MDAEALRRIFFRDSDHTEAEWLELVAQFRHIVQWDGSAARPFKIEIPPKVVETKNG
jgi:hypothetical protein